MNNISWPKNITTIIAGLIISVWVTIIFWARNKGLDLTDEGFYLFKYFSPSVSFSNFSIVQNFLFPFFSPTIQNLRIEKLILCFITSIIYSISAKYYLLSVFKIEVVKSDFFMLFCVIFSGICLTYAFGPQTLGYNFFSSIFLLLTTSFFIIDVSKKNNKWIVLVIYLIIGSFTGFLFLIKFSNAILLFLTIMAFYLLNSFFFKTNKKTLIQLFFRVLVFFVGFFLTHLCIFKSFENVLQFYHDFKITMTTLKGYSFQTLAQTYYASIIVIFDSFISFKFILPFLSLIGVLWGYHKNRNSLSIIFLLVHLFTIVYYKIFMGGEANKTQQTIIYLLWIFTLLLFTVIKHPIKTLKSSAVKQQSLFISLLLFLPIIGALGTNNQIHIQIIFYMPFLMTVLFILIKKNIPFKHTPFVFLFFIALASVQSIDAVLFHPYRINGTLFSQNQEIEVNKEVILVDTDFKNSLFAIKNSLHQANFTSADYLFHYSDLAGLPYFLNFQAIPNNTGWYGIGETEDNCGTLNALKTKEFKGKLFFMLDNRNFKNDSIVNCWATANNLQYSKLNDIYINFSLDPHYLSVYAPF